MTSTPISKKDDQDGSFLIIDDSVNTVVLPDTAVELFHTPEVASVSEISFFSEPLQVATIEEDSSTGIAFFEPSTTTLLASDSEEKTESESVAFFMETPSEVQVISDSAIESVKNVQEETSVSLFDNVLAESPKEPEIIAIVATPEKNDIYAPIRKAISEYDTILLAHAQIAEAKDVEIVDYNAQIAEAKRIAKQTIDKAQESAKKALSERKALEVEIDRVKQMKELFSAQLK